MKGYTAAKPPMSRIVGKLPASDMHAGYWAFHARKHAPADIRSRQSQQSKIRKLEKQSMTINPSRYVPVTILLLIKKDREAARLRVRTVADNAPEKHGADDCHCRPSPMRTERVDHVLANGR